MNGRTSSVQVCKRCLSTLNKICTEFSVVVGTREKWLINWKHWRVKNGWWIYVASNENIMPLMYSVFDSGDSSQANMS